MLNIKIKMNLRLINSIFSHYFLLSTKSKLILPTLPKIWFHQKATPAIPYLINQTQITQLPFLLKLRFVKTIKALVPQVTYQYVSKPTRLVKSFRYPKQIQQRHASYKNSTNLHTRLYTLLLKI